MSIDWASEFPELAGTGAHQVDLERVSRNLETTAVALGRAIESIGEVVSREREVAATLRSDAGLRAESEQRRLDRIERALRETLQHVVAAQDRGAAVFAEALAESLRDLQLPTPVTIAGGERCEIDLSPLRDAIVDVGETLSRAIDDRLARLEGAIAESIALLARSLSQALTRPREVVHRVEREGGSGKIVRLRSRVAE